MIEVKTGQLWADADRRDHKRGRVLLVYKIDGDYAFCQVVTNTTHVQQYLNHPGRYPDRAGLTDRVGRTTKIMLRRFYTNARGYTLLKDI
jgi:hypothetical protein